MISIGGEECKQIKQKTPFKARVLKQKETSHSFPRPSSKMVLFYPFLVLLIMILFLFMERTKEKKEEAMLLARQQEAGDLIHVGLFSEAIRILKENQNLRTPIDDGLLFQAYLENKEYPMAERVWKTLDVRQQKEKMERLISGLAEEGKVSQAWSILVSYQNLLSRQKQMDIGYSLLSKIQEIPISAEFVNGWVHHNLAILKDAEGYYLVNSAGDPIFSERYNQITPIEKGFLVEKKDKLLLLDPDGQYLSLYSSNQSWKAEPSQPSFEVKVGGGKQKNNYTWNGMVLTKTSYDSVSPVSRRGVGYAEYQGKNYLLRFNALQEGVAFNKIEETREQGSNP